MNRPGRHFRLIFPTDGVDVNFGRTYFRNRTQPKAVWRRKAWKEERRFSPSQVYGTW